jgi:hypothetical protein
MLKNTTPLTHGIQCRRKTTSVVALDLPYLTRWTTIPITPPTLAGRVANNRVRSCVQARIALFVPRIYTIEAYVAPVRLDVQSCDNRVAHTGPASMGIVSTKAIRLPIQAIQGTAMLLPIAR